jgi:hypothetical protein
MQATRVLFQRQSMIRFVGKRSAAAREFPFHSIVDLGNAADHKNQS